MTRIILPLPIFERRLVKFLKYHPELKQDTYKTIRLLENDIFLPSLKTHKLHGKFDGSYGCNIDYQYRIVFSFDEKFVYLENIGSHDDVY